MTEYFICSNCDYMFDDSERDHDIQQPMCRTCADTDPEFYSSYGR
jgi:rubredoxin